MIDIERLRNGADPGGVGAELARAATEAGFLYVRNHGVDAAIVGRARRTALEFFRLPEEARREAGTNRFHHGYLKPGSTQMYDGARLDLKESFNWGIELDGGSGTDAPPTNPLLGPNVWPAAMPALKPSVHPYFEAASACAEDLLRGFALGAGLDAEHFIRHRDRPVSRGFAPVLSPTAGRRRGGSVRRGPAYRLRDAHRAQPGRDRRTRDPAAHRRMGRDAADPRHPRRQRRGSARTLVEPPIPLDPAPA